MSAEVKAAEERLTLLREPVPGTPRGWLSALRYMHDHEREQRSQIKTRPIVRIEDGKVDWGVEPGPGDEIGYGMGPFTFDDCLRAAIATAVQVPAEDVPYRYLRSREARERPHEVTHDLWGAITHWADGLGLTVRHWPKAELPPPRHRWIAVLERPGTGDKPFNDHCLVMSGDHVVWDPLCSVRPPPGLARWQWDPSDLSSLIKYGITFDRKDQSCQAR